MENLSQEQQTITNQPAKGRVFLEGPAGCGKTTAGAARLLALIEMGVPANTILVVTPQRTLAAPYVDALQEPGLAAGGLASAVTFGGLARRLVDLFWPLIAARAGFKNPAKQPHFLTLETAQYYMSRIVRPLLGEGYFDAVTLERNRLYSQIIDNINKAAVVGFPVDEIEARLRLGSSDEVLQNNIVANVQECANRFRAYCLENNLLDFSLQVEVFRKHLWPVQLCREYLRANYRHLIADNVEEDTPISHDILYEWLPDFESGLLIYDVDAGYRRFLGADAQSALALAERCEQRVTFSESFATTGAMKRFAAGFEAAMQPAGVEREPGELSQGDLAEVIAYPQDRLRVFPEMVAWVAEEIAGLVETGTAPGEIVVLAPFLSDSLRFSLSTALEKAGVPYRSHRPSRSLREEPATRCLLTLAKLAHPDWKLQPDKYDFTYALTQAISELDLVRAHLLTENVYRTKAGTFELSSFEAIKAEMQERITFLLGNRYETLRGWIEAYKQNPADDLDFFLSKLFGEVLSQPGFGFHENLEAGAVAADLIESIRKFRWALDGTDLESGKSTGKEYIEMVEDGVIAAQYLPHWDVQENCVLLAPAYTFLMYNKPVDYQFWLEIENPSWAARLYQPLTNPYILSRGWPADRRWTSADELEAETGNICRLSVGLIRRCRRRIYLAYSELNEQGYENRGVLLKTIQRMYRNTVE